MQRRIDLPTDSMTGLLDYGNMEELDDAGTTFCIEPVKAGSLGIWNFLCTRNNNFSNRSQKGSLIVSNAYVNQVSATSEGQVTKAEEGQARVIVLPMSVKEGDSLKCGFHILQSHCRFQRHIIERILMMNGRNIL